MTNRFMKIAFPTFLLMRDYKGEDIDALNQRLSKSILERSTSGDPGIKKSNAGLTWHSAYDMQDWCDGLTDFLGIIKENTNAFLMQYGARPGDRFNTQIVPWAMVARGGGDYATPHTHPRCQFSGCYYVQPGEPDLANYPYSGKLEFIDPTRSGHCSVQGMKGWHQRVLVSPQPGRLVMFPADLGHMVHPFFGTGERIAIAFNVHISSYQPVEEKSL